jgi:hypothetical protein
MEDVGLAVCSGCWPEVGGPSHEFRFWFPCDGTFRDCPVEVRDARSSGLSDRNDKGAGGDGDGGWLSFFLKNLPKIFFGPLVGVELISWRMIVGVDGDAWSMPAEESEWADEAGVCAPSGYAVRGVNC